MNKKVKCIIILTLTILLIAIATVLVINELGYHYNIEEITEFNYFILVQNEKYGVIDKNGNTIINAEYEAVQIPNPSKPIFVCIKGYNQETKDYDTVVYNEKNEEILNQYKNVQAISIFANINSIPYEKSVLTYKENGKYGLINLNGKQITKPIYDEISSINYNEGTFIVKCNDLEGVINMKGKVIVECKYQSVNSDNYYYTNGDLSPKAGYIVSQKNEEGYRYGYINSKGKTIIEPIYTQLNRVTEITNDKNLYFVAYKNGQAGLLKNNKEILNYEYEEIQFDFLSNIFFIKRNGKYGAVDKEATTILYPEYSSIYTSGIYLNTTKDDQNTYMYDLKGNYIQTNLIYKDTTENPNYYITIDQNSIYKVVDQNDNIIIDNDYNYIEYLFDDYFIVTRDLKNGIIDSSGKSIIELKYDNIFLMNDTDIVIMELNETTELYDKNLQQITSMQNALIETLKDNKQYLVIYSENDMQYIEKSGKLATSQQVYENNTLFSKKINQKWGFVNENGELVIQNEYELVTDFNKYGYAGIKKDGKWGIINLKGEIICEPQYTLNWEMPEFIGKYYRINAWYDDMRFTDEIKED